MPRSRRRAKVSKQRRKPSPGTRKQAPAPARDGWRLGTVELLGATLERARACLSHDVAWDLVREVVKDVDSAPVIGTAASCHRTPPPSGQLSAEESDRLLDVGRPYLSLECADSVTGARDAGDATRGSGPAIGDRARRFSRGHGEYSWPIGTVRKTSVQRRPRGRVDMIATFCTPPVGRPAIDIAYATDDSR